MEPWWALVVGLISGLTFLCLSVLSIALCINCARKKSQEKQKLEDPETASNNNEKAYINHAIVHDEDETTQNGGPDKEGTTEENGNEEDGPQVPPKFEDTGGSETPASETIHKKQNGVRWKETPEIIKDHHSSDDEDEENEAGNRDSQHTDETEHHNVEETENDEEVNEEQGEDLEERHESPENDDDDDCGNDDDDDDAFEHTEAGAAGAGFAAGAVGGTVTLDPSKVSLIRLVREGVYGAIYKGEIEINGKDIPALIKTFPENAPYTEEQKNVFLQEATKFHSLEHKHLASPYGVTEKREMPLVVYPEANLLDLKSYIVDPHHVLSVRHMLDFSLNMAEAMEYLHQHDIVHEDLAARNCWLTDALVIRICDGAFSKELFPEDYETTREITEPMPIRWMAPECLQASGNFTKSSDVWAYGILIWELFKRGENRPYWELPTQKVYNNVIDGDVLIKPFFAPDNVYELIRQCWSKSQEDRPTFEDIVKTFANEIHKRTSGRRTSTAHTND